MELLALTTTCALSADSRSALPWAPTVDDARPRRTRTAVAATLRAASTALSVAADRVAPRRPAYSRC